MASAYQVDPRLSEGGYFLTICPPAQRSATTPSSISGRPADLQLQRVVVKGFA